MIAIPAIALNFGSSTPKSGPILTRQPAFRGQSRSDAEWAALAAQTRKVSQNGYGVSNRIYFELKTDKTLDARDILRVQQEKGFHPAGYGNGGFSKEPAGNQTIYHWYCYASCD